MPGAQESTRNNLGNNVREIPPYDGTNILDYQHAQWKIYVNKELLYLLPLENVYTFGVSIQFL
jgi:hypothetical protein